MKRRTFITLIGATAASSVVSAVAVHAQQIPVIGFLCSASPAPWASFVAAFRAGLEETGHVDGRNLAIDFRWAEGQYDRLPQMAVDLVRRNVAVLVSTGGVPPIAAAKAATRTIPIVFTLGSDPVELGVVDSLSRPGGNVTGAVLFTAMINAKRLGVLRDTVPTTTLIAALLNSKNPNLAGVTKNITEAARAVGLRVHFLHASNERELDAAFAALPQLGAGALLVASDPFFNDRRDHVVALAARSAIPAIYEERQFAAAGGLMSYGADFVQSYRQAGIYTGRILKGEKPGELPVVQSTKFAFVINLKTAKALGLEIPPGVSAQADEIIE
jgi:putative tryptophan/tyrosine transport system substrate-binding protein